MFPQLLKLLLLEFLLLEVSFLWFTSILYLDSLRIEHPVQSLYNTSFNRLKLFAKTECLRVLKLIAMRTRRPSFSTVIVSPS